MALFSQLLQKSIQLRQPNFQKRIGKYAVDIEIIPPPPPEETKLIPDDCRTPYKSIKKNGAGTGLEGGRLFRVTRSTYKKTWQMPDELVRSAKIGRFSLNPGTKARARGTSDA